MKGQIFMLFIDNGLFHLEVEIISNLSLCELQYDPYGKTLTDKWYDTKAVNTIMR